MRDEVITIITHYSRYKRTRQKQINRAKKGITKHTHKQNNKDMCP